MRNRHEQILKLICLVFGAVLAFQLALAVVHGTSTRRLIIPALPVLPPEADAVAKNTNSATPKSSNKSPTNGTNSASAAKSATNISATNRSSKLTGTNLIVAKTVPIQATNSVLPKASGTNSVASETFPATNAATNEVSGKTSSNSVATQASGKKGATNLVTESTPGKGSTNSPLTAGARKGPSFGRSGPGGKGPELPPQIKERVDRVTQSEMLGQVMHPMPMALLGIAGESAFLRSPEGQTGLVKEGDQLGTIKLLRIGTNRVVIEQDGEKKELLMFAGLGSETLLPKPEKATNETTKKFP